MDEKQLKGLQIVKIDEARKEQDYLRVQQKLRKQKHINWRVPAVVIATCAIIVLLLITNPFIQQEQTTSEDVQVVKIHATHQDFIPTSGWLSNVLTVKNEDVISRYSELLNTMQPIEANLEVDTILMLRFKLADGTVRDFEYRWAGGNIDYFYEPTTGISYDLSNLNLQNNRVQIFGTVFWNFQDNKWKRPGTYLLLFGVAVLFIVRWILMNKMMKETGLNEKPKQNSSIWQTIVIMASPLIILLALFEFEGLHFGYVFSIVCVNLLIYLIIERIGDNNRWRKQNSIISFGILLLWAVFIIYPSI